MLEGTSVRNLLRCLSSSGDAADVVVHISRGSYIGRGLYLDAQYDQALAVYAKALGIRRIC